MKNIGNIRTDLALEAREALTNEQAPEIDGVIYKTEKKLSFHYLIFNLKFKLYETENIYFK